LAAESPGACAPMPVNIFTGIPTAAIRTLFPLDVPLGYSPDVKKTCQRYRFKARARVTVKVRNNVTKLFCTSEY